MAEATWKGGQREFEEEEKHVVLRSDSCISHSFTLILHPTWPTPPGRTTFTLEPGDHWLRSELSFIVGVPAGPLGSCCCQGELGSGAGPISYMKSS